MNRQYVIDVIGTDLICINAPETQNLLDLSYSSDDLFTKTEAKKHIKDFKTLKLGFKFKLMKIS